MHRLVALASAMTLLVATLASASPEARKVPLRATITRVQPMTGLVLWTDHEAVATAPIQLEYGYMKYGDVCARRGEYDWRPVEETLAAVASRSHQAILRFHFVYPGRATTVPAYIKALPDYRETRGTSEGRVTWFPDWRHPELKRFTKEFHERLAARFDKDRRLAFLQTGFGLWAEYHIYDGPMELGRTFPDRAFQGEHLRNVVRVFEETPVQISIDSAEDHGPFADASLLALGFGAFDDSLNHASHATDNMPKWRTIGRDRYLRAPVGGELSYADQDQRKALAPDGPHGVSFEKHARDLGLTFAIANDQPSHQPMSRIESAGLATGYRFRVVAFETTGASSTVTIENRGVAPIYQDAFPTVNGVRAVGSLKLLGPGARKTFTIASGGTAPALTIACDRLVPGQKIEFEANLAP